MHHTNRRLPSAARWIAGALAAFLPFAAFALGLGKLTVRSALNEPLNAEVEISSISEKELKGLQVGLAPRAEFEQAGVERLQFLSDIKFNVSKRGDGNYFIQLRSDQRIQEPFLHMLLAVEWPGGRMVREYTALIDPPTQLTGKPSGIEVPTTTSEPVTIVTPATGSIAPEPIVEEPKPLPPVAQQPAAAAEPELRPVAPPAESPAPAPAEPPVAAVEPLTPPTAPKAMPHTPRSEASVAAGWSQEGGYNVKWGDTAWRIAETLRTDDSHSIEQIVLALYRVNPQAFFGNNINNLKAGQILKLPEAAQIEAVAPTQARSEFRAQYDAWQEYKIKLAGASGAIKVVDGESKPAPQVADSVAPAETKSAEAPPVKKEPEKTAKAPATKTAQQQQEELLKIVRTPDQGEKTTPDKKPAEGEARKGGAAAEQQTLSDRVAALEESLTSKQMENKEIGDKVAQVRAQLKREARLIQIEQQQLAAAQNKAQPPQPQPEAAPAPKPEAAAPKPEPAPAPKPEAPKTEAAKPEPAPAPAAEKPAAAAPAKKPAAAAPPPPQEKGFVDDVMESVLGGDNVLLIVLGVVVLLSGAIALVYLNRRRKSIAEFEESILQSEGIVSTSGAPAVTTDTSGQIVSTGDTSFLSDFSQGGMGNIHTDEVDPIAEAEVYLAYGRDETAEEILKEAVVKNPAREELKLKLLEIYANRSDVRAFETLAEEMYAAMGGRPSKHWPRVEELGRKLNPNNPMFRGGGAAAGAGMAAAAVAAPSFADTAKMKAPAPTTTTIAPPEAKAAAPADSAGDFDFDLSAAPVDTASADAGFDLDLGGSDSSASKAEKAAVDFDAELGLDSSGAGDLDVDIGKSGSNLVDFDFGDKEESASAAAPQTEFAVAEHGAGAEAVTGDVGESPQWDETATKLDLARAYIDMGDSEGARSILDEVLSEGNEQQKKQAKELVAQIG
jgi:pilus assembly protein FimV